MMNVIKRYWDNILNYFVFLSWQGFSFARLLGVIHKEFIQFSRDRSTFMMVISMPIMQLILFGYAINVNPRHLPTALINQDNGPFSRALVKQLENTRYFNFNYFPKTETEANLLMDTHQVLFTLTVPSDFSHQIVKGQVPQALLEVDGTDPVSVAYAVSASNGLLPSLFRYELHGVLAKRWLEPAPQWLRVHIRYNPSGVTQFNIVPGLLGTILTLTFVMVASMALTRERERGTMESLLMTPVLPLEVMIGKAAPFIVVGYVQVLVIVLLAMILFAVPMVGNPIWLAIAALPFILANLAVGMTISTFSKSQLEASQFSIFFFLPSILLSGFAFPYQGLPAWAKAIADVLPLTHFIKIVRGVMLKGIPGFAVWYDLWPILLFMGFMLVIALKRYSRKLD